MAIIRILTWNVQNLFLAGTADGAPDTEAAFDEKVSSSFPPVLPKKSWPQPLYNLYWRVINFVVKLAS